ncbi:single-stranded DNA-binding protein (plasmid) [Novosphingobium pentaromativorans US6-1]|nr:single-stranded DNA-binding protein [Novosphingobium pentaromativorans US6-1]
MKNLVILIGRIAAAPETRHAGETAITSFTLVTDRPKLVDGKTVKNEAGYTETLAEFHRVTAFNGLGTSVA